MQYKSFKKLSGEKLSAIGLGTWAFSGGEAWPRATEKQSINTLHQAVDLGINFIDTAPVYGLGVSEQVVAKAIKGKRDQLFIASKCGLVWDAQNNVTNDLSRNSLPQQIDESLKRLNVEVIDLMQVHWPDPNTSIDETFETLAKIKQAGKIRYIGVSNYSLEDMKLAGEFAEIASHQGLYNILERNPKSYHGIELTYQTENEILPYLKENGMFFLPYSPLLQGLLAGEFYFDHQFSKGDVRGANPMLTGEEFKYLSEKAQALQKIAEKHKISLVQLSLAWLVHQPAMGPIICGAITPDEIKHNAQAGDIVLTEDIFADLIGVID